jgi:hypothetical protein
MTIKHLIVSVGLFCLAMPFHPLCAQEKYEKERSLKQEEVPPKAQEVIEALSLRKREIYE